MPARPSWHEDKRKTAERGYGAAWQKARLKFLEAHPLCEMCKKQGRIKAAQVVDHRIPHRMGQAAASGNAAEIAKATALFWDQSNWSAICKTHHDSDKQALERSGTVKVVIGLDGWPEAS